MLRSIVVLSTILGLVTCQGIILPTGVHNFTDVDCSGKDSGIDMSTASAQGYMGIGALANQKGAHLATAAQSILSVSNDSTSAMAVFQSLQSLASTPASTNASASSSATWSKALIPYLQYWDGDIMSQPHNFSVYLIFYGTWSLYQQHLIRNFIDSMGPAPVSAVNEHTVQNWWKITSSYYHDAQNQTVTNQVVLAGDFTDNYSRAPQGSALNPLQKSDIMRIVTHALKKSFGTPSNRGIYMVLTSPDVYVNNFCTAACGYHSSFRYNNVPIAFAHIGNAKTQCPIQCTYKYMNMKWVPPNGDLGVDGMMTWLAHEMTEVATNPFQAHNRKPGWVVAQSTVENGDLCVWDFGAIKYNPKGPYPGAEYTLTGKDRMTFMVQRNFNLKLKLCVTVGNGLPDD